MKRRSFLAGAAALAATPVLPVGPVGAVEEWVPFTPTMSEMLALEQAWRMTAIQRIFNGQMTVAITSAVANSGAPDEEIDDDYWDEDYH